MLGTWLALLSNRICNRGAAGAATGDSILLLAKAIAGFPASGLSISLEQETEDTPIAIGQIKTRFLARPTMVSIDAVMNKRSHARFQGG